MKKVILLILLIPLFSGVLKAQQQVIVYPGYTSYWNPLTLIPDSVIWVTKPHVKVCGREAGFHATGDRVNQRKDYAHSGYDIGHNADASDMNGDKTDEYNSFDFANAFPQRPNNNRLVWLRIEDYTRSLNQPVNVKVYWQGIKGYLIPDNVAIPTYTIKELRYAGQFEKYVVPNDDTVSKHAFTYYRVK